MGKAPPSVTLPHTWEDEEVILRKMNILVVNPLGRNEGIC